MKRFLKRLFSARALLVLATLVLAAMFFTSALPGLLKLLALGVLAGVAVLVGAGFWAGRRWHVRRRATRLEDALNQDMAQAAHAQASTADDDAAKAQELRQRLQEAIRTIKRSRLGQHGGRAALYELPWYMLIGLPSAGKSTAIVQSGLRFPFAHGKEQVLRGIGGTRNCDWFFTSEGILLDTAGRYAVERENRSEWLSFLGMLRQHRPRAPINGIVVAASVAVLRDAAADDMQTHARALRARVQELTDTLEVQAPLYLLFTKADLIPGFADFFAEHDPREREQVWGATLPAQPGQGDALALFERHFDTLREGLQAAALARMALHRGQPLPPAVLAFPLEFAALQPALRAFVATLFEDNRYQVQPLLRGFYFTSAVQSGEAPVAAAGRDVAAQFGLVAPATAAPTPAPTEHGYFLKSLFSEVIFADRELVRRLASPARQRLRTLGYAGGVLALASVLALWSWSYVGNRQVVAGVQADLDKALRLQEGRLDLASRIEALELLQNRIEELAAWRTQRPWTVGLGLYQGEAVEARLRQACFLGLRRVMLEPVAQALEGYLAEVNRHAEALQPAGTDAAPPSAAPAGASEATRYAQPSPTDAEEAYKALKTYLMLAERPRMEPGHLTDQVTRFWRGWLDDNRGTLPREQLLRSAERLISFAMAHLQDPLFPVIDNNFALVDQTREQLRRVVQGTPAIERVYGDIKVRASTRYAPVTVAALVGERDHALLAGSHVVSGAFTREAWQGYVEGAIKEAAHGELQSADWVLRSARRDDLSLQGSPQQIRRALTERYKAEYVREWQRFVQGVAVAPFGGFDTAAAHMNRLGDPTDSPLRKLLLALVAQTSWDNPSLLAQQASTQAREGVAEWLRQSMQRWSPAPVEVKLEAGPGGRGDDAAPGPALGPVGRAFAAPARLLAARDGGGSLLDGYLQHLARLRSRFNTIRTQGDAGPGARALMAATFAGEGSELSEALRFVEEQMLGGGGGSGDDGAAALKPLLLRPLMQSFAVLVPPAETELNRLWTAQVLQPFQQALAGKYPFDPSSRVEAAPAEVARVFGPAGAVARFATEVMGPLAMRRGDDIAPRQWAQLGLRLRPAFVQGLSAWVAPLDGAAGGSASDSTGAAATVQASFQLLPLGAPGFVEYALEIDGQVLRYRNGAAHWSAFVWPRAGTTPGARLSGITLDGRTLELFSAPGAYGFERLIEAAQVKKLPDGVRELSWGEGAQAIAVQYRAITSPGPASAAPSGGQRRGGGLRGLSLPSLVTGEEAPGTATVAALPVSGAAR